MFAGGGTLGHILPVAPVARALREANPGIKIYFVGTMKGLERDYAEEKVFSRALIISIPEVFGAGSPRQISSRCINISKTILKVGGFSEKLPPISSSGWEDTSRAQSSRRRSPGK